MKRILTIILLFTLCFLCVSCNETKTPTESNLTEDVTQSTEQSTENSTQSTETDEMLPKPERIKDIHFAESGKIDFPDKEILYIRYSIREQILPIQAPYERVVKTTVFEDPEIIKNIIDCFESSELRPASQPYFSDKNFKIYYADNTYISVSMANIFTVCYDYHSEGQEPVIYYYYISPEAKERLYAIIK